MLLFIIGVLLTLLPRREEGKVGNELGEPETTVESFEYDWGAIERLAEEYLQPFSNFDQVAFAKTADYALEEAYGRGATVIVQVIDQAIWVDMTKFTTIYPWDRLRMHHVLGRLKDLLKRRRLGDFEFILNTHDCPIRGLPISRVPIFTMTKCRGMSTIPLPQWFRWRDGQWRGWDKRVRRYAEAGLSIPWGEKNTKAVFLGSIRPSCLRWDNDTLNFVNLSVENWRELGRTKLYSLAQEQPDLLHVGLFGKGVEASRLLLEMLGEEWHYTAPISMTEQATKFRHALVVEGACGWADRLKGQLAMGMTILLQETPCHEWFTPLLQDGYHHVSLRNDLSNVIERINWLQKNSLEAYEIGQQGAQLMATLLGQAGWDRYFERIMLGYASLSNYQIRRRANAKRFLKETNCPNHRNYKCNDASSFSSN